MKNKKIKNTKPFDDEDEDEPRLLNSQISVGEIVVVGKRLKNCEQTITRLIKNKSVQSYLNSFERKILSKIPSYIE